MGFWNITAKDLHEGDEVRVRVMGGEEFLTVERVEKADEGMRVEMEWGLHIPNAETVHDVLDPDLPLTVRR